MLISASSSALFFELWVAVALGMFFIRSARIQVEV